MKADAIRLLEFLRRSTQFIIPIYQRTYSWTEVECRQLWDDIIRVGKSSGTQMHFIGSIVYIEAGQSQIANPTGHLVIDGQQRLTSIMLILEALARELGDEREPFADFSSRKVRNRYLIDPEENGDRRFKLLLTQGDRPALLSIIEVVRSI